MKEDKYKERFEKAADVMQSVNKNSFDIGEFGQKVDNSCGTIACIAGHCALDPWFRRRGFCANFDSDGELTPTQGREWWEMIPEFFGPCASDCVVVPCEYLPIESPIRPKSVAKALRKFVRDYYS